MSKNHSILNVLSDYRGSIISVSASETDLEKLNAIWIHLKAYKTNLSL